MSCYYADLRGNHLLLPTNYRGAQNSQQDVSLQSTCHDYWYVPFNLSLNLWRISQKYPTLSKAIACNIFQSNKQITLRSEFFNFIVIFNTFIELYCCRCSPSGFSCQLFTNGSVVIIVVSEVARNMSETQRFKEIEKEKCW